MVSNTIYTCGRSGIVARYSPAASILHNRIYNCALQTTDAGGIYTYLTDGAGAEIAYNVVSGIRTAGFGGSGIYLDNGSTHYLVDHNVVWNCDAALKMNPPSDDNEIDNNTFVGVTNSLATASNPNMTGSTFVNNIFVGEADFGPGVDATSNLLPPADPLFVDPGQGDYRLARHSPAIKSGQPLDGASGKKSSKRPDEGAYAFGKKAFTSGAAARKSVRV
jgi:hypothetical protein